MLETARRLAQSGERIARLVMVDAYPHPRAMSIFVHGRMILRRILNRVLYSSGLSNTAAPSARLKEFMAHMPRATPYMARVRASGHAARMRYRPSPYAGAVHFIRSSNTPQFPPNPRSAWGKYIKGMTIDTVSGSHLELVTGNVDRLAQVLTHCLAD